VRLGPAALRGALADEAERVIDGLLAGPLPEAVARSIVRHRVVNRVVDEVLETAEPGSKDGGDPLELAVERVVAMPAFKRALQETLSSPEVRSALVSQTTGFGGELARAVRVRARRVDARLGTEQSRSAAFGGFASRGIALVVDALLAQLAFLVLGASVSLVAWLAGASRPGVLGGALAGGGWLIVVAAYFTVFWSSTGQTPGMHLVGVRVRKAAGGVPGALRSLVRCAGLVVSILTLGLGFLPALVDRRRRALPDFLAGTVVVQLSEEER
jgi:uncharacterized RDD family membrane protein YckC